MATANPIAVTSTGVKMAGQAFVTLFRWVSPNAAAGDTCLVVDGDGNTIFESEATGADFIDGQSISKDQEAFRGINVQTLTSGTLYIHLR